MIRYHSLPPAALKGEFAFAIYLAPEPCSCALTASWWAIPGTFVD